MSKDGAIVLHGMGGSKVWTRGHKGVATGFTLISSRNRSEERRVGKECW